MFGVRRLEEGASGVSGDAFEEGVDRGGEPDDEASAFEGGPVRGVEHGTAAGGDDAAGHVSDGFDGDGFNLAESGFPVGAKDLADFAPRSGFDEFVGVDELEPDAFGEDASHGGFPAAHEADEDDVLRTLRIVGHGVGLPASVQDTGRRRLCTQGAGRIGFASRVGAASVGCMKRFQIARGGPEVSRYAYGMSRLVEDCEGAVRLRAVLERMGAEYGCTAAQVFELCTEAKGHSIS